MANINGSHVLLDTNQLQAIKNEIATDPQDKGYTGKTVGGINKLINEKSLIDNPIPQAQINRPVITSREFIEGADFSNDELTAIVSNPFGKVAFDMLLGIREIDTNSGPAVRMLLKMRNDGLIQDATWNRILGLKTMPDPSWQPQIYDSSRAEVLLGAGYSVEGPDVMAALAL